MTKASELEHPRTDQRPDHNGTPSLSDRVRSLRLTDETTGRNSSKGSALPWLLCLILLGTTAALGYRAYRVTPAEETSTTSQTTEKPVVMATTEVAGTGEVVLQAKGYVVPVHQVQVSPKVGGVIVYLDPKFEEGMHFNEGDILARLEDVDYLADRDHAKGVVETAEWRLKEQLNGNRPEEIEQSAADLAETEKNLRQMKLDLDRNSRLAPGGGVAARDFELAKYGYEAMERRAARLRAAHKLMVEGAREERKKAAQGDLIQAKADLAKAQWRLDNTVIRAPIGGTILTKKAERGNLVTPSAFSGGTGGLSVSLCDMADLSDIEIDLSIQERDVANVKVGQEASVMPEAFQSHKPFLEKYPTGYKGTVSRLMPIADRAKGAVPVRVRVIIPKEEEGVYLKPDMGALVSFKKAEAKK
jgi:multidrug resistance efflux pump